MLKTEIIRLDKNNIDLDKVRYAAGVLRKGGLVAFPTETVYGLGANAMDTAAVAKIFEAKGRPSDNPLIVHIADIKSLSELAVGSFTGVSPLMERFWPGPLTLVMNKSQKVPSVITAGLDTVAIRVPSHPIALALIKEAGIPVAAPSANTSGKPSPTSAAHVIEDLTGKVDIIIDGGTADVGLESTVLDVTEKPAVILRPGGITPEQLREVLGEVNIDPALVKNQTEEFIPRAPGMKYTHYSPKAEVIIVEGSMSAVVQQINTLAQCQMSKGVRVGILTTEQTRSMYPQGEIICMGDRDNPETIAANLFSSLREFDSRGVELILAEAVDSSGIGLAVMNRMNKAAGYNIIRAEYR